MAEIAGELDVRALLHRTPAKRFRAWEQYLDMVEPLDAERRADYRFASIREAVWNTQLAAKDRKPLDFFMLKFDAPNEAAPVADTRQSAEEQVRIIKILVGSMTGVFVE